MVGTLVVHFCCCCFCIYITRHELDVVNGDQLSIHCGWEVGGWRSECCSPLQVMGDTFYDQVILVCLTPLRGGRLSCLTARLLRRPMEIGWITHWAAAQTKQIEAVKVWRRAALTNCHLQTWSPSVQEGQARYVSYSPTGKSSRHWLITNRY